MVGSTLLEQRWCPAAAQACPVVATGSALRGFGPEIGQTVLSADDPVVFGKFVADLLEKAEAVGVAVWGLEPPTTRGGAG